MFAPSADVDIDKIEVERDLAVRFTFQIVKSDVHGRLQIGFSPDYCHFTIRCARANDAYREHFHRDYKSTAITQFR